MADDPPGVTRRRWRAGWRWPLDLLVWSVFAALGGAGVVVAAVRGDLQVAFVGAVIATFSLVLVVRCASGLRPVRVEGDPPVLIVPTFSWRQGLRQVRCPLAEVETADLVSARTRVPSMTARIVWRGQGVLMESLSCSRSWRHPERTRAGRAAREIRRLADVHRIGKQA